MGDFYILGAKNDECEDYGIPVYAEMMRKEPDTTTSNHGTPDKGGGYWWVEPDSIFMDYKNVCNFTKMFVNLQKCG